VIGAVTPITSFSKHQRRQMLHVVALVPISLDMAVERTGYYFNNELPYLTLIAKGVRLPAGRWTRIADDEHPPWKVQELITRTLAVKEQVPFVALLSDFDLQEFEMELGATTKSRSHLAR
jgi:hypothetical protein